VERPSPRHRDPIGSVVGLVTFLGGVAVLLVVFSLAYRMFTLPPSDALGLVKDKPIDVNTVGPSLATVVIRILLLLLMGLVGSMIANRGIGLYSRSLHEREKPAPS
jgi:hypothetical protein